MPCHDPIEKAANWRLLLLSENEAPDFFNRTAIDLHCRELIVG